jgi:MscS family membrane protein
MRRLILLILGGIIVIVASAQLETLPELAERFPAPLQHTLLHVAAWQWAGLAFIVVVASLAGIITRTIFARLTRLRDRLVGHAMTDGTRKLICIAVGMLAGAALSVTLLADLQLPDRFNHAVLDVVEGFALLSAVLILYGLWDAVCDSLAARAVGYDRAERLLIPVARRLVRAIIVVIGILITLAAFFGAETITGLAAGLGVGGIVVALAAKDSLENVFASITILFDMPFALGDWIKMDKVEGSVEEINLRSTRIRSIDDTVITLPNANLIRNPVENFGARRFRRQRMELRVSYGSDPKALQGFCEAMRTFLNELPHAEKKPGWVELDNPGETSIGVVLIWWLDVSESIAEAQSRDAALEEALRQGKQLGIRFAPTAPNYT